MRLKILVILGYIIGLINVFVGAIGSGTFLFLILGAICLLLSVGLSKYWKWSRIAAIIFSIIFVAHYILLIVAILKGYFQGFGIIGLIVNAPLLFLCLLYIDYLNQRDIKAKFFINKNSVE